MGMFDTVRSSYPLIDPEADLELQTKDLDCLMNQFWISPVGQLYRVEFCSAYDAVEISEELRQSPWQMIQWLRNGKHGSVTPDYRSALIRLYPGRVMADQQWREVKVYLRHGNVVEILRDQISQS